MNGKEKENNKTKPTKYSVSYRLINIHYSKCCSINEISRKQDLKSSFLIICCNCWDVTTH